jgi:multidrug resistance protein, MATE family
LSQTKSIQVANSYRNIIKLALPILIAILIPQLSMLINTYFLGYYAPHVGLYQKQDLLSASGIAGIYYLTTVMVGYGLAGGLLMLMSRKAGENDTSGLGKLVSNGIVLALLVSSSILLISLFLAPFLFSKFIHEIGVRESAIAFIKIRTWGLPFILLGQIGNNFFLATSNSKFIIYGSILETCLNILFDYLLIFGHAGFPEMGLSGSAIASVIAEMGYFSCIWLIIRFYPIFKIYHIQFFKKIDWQICKTIFLKSSPLMMQYFLSIGAWELFFIYVEHLGKAESAISQILRSVFGIVGVATWALASTCNSMVSNLIGQEKFDEVIPMIHRIVRVSFTFSFIVGLPVILFPTSFLHLLTNDVELIKLGFTSLQIVIVAVWMLSIATIYFNGVLGTGNTRINMMFEFIAIIFYIIYISIAVEYLKLPLPFAWASEFIYWLSLFSLSAYFLYAGKWKKYVQLNK